MVFQEDVFGDIKYYLQLFSMNPEQWIDDAGL